jgi:hypothetical protein
MRTVELEVYLSNVAVECSEILYLVVVEIIRTMLTAGSFLRVMFCEGL